MTLVQKHLGDCLLLLRSLAAEAFVWATVLQPRAAFWLGFASLPGKEKT